MAQRPKLKLTLLAVALGGCSQLIGLSDYDIDPALNGPGAGGESGEGNGGSDSPDKGGKSSGISGEPGSGGDDVGIGGVPVGGAPGSSGAPGSAGTPMGESGAPGEAGAGGSGGPPDPPEVVIPCDSVACCSTANGVVKTKELLSNLGFEKGPTYWGESSSGNYDLITEQSADTINAHAGTWFVWLGGDTNETAVMLTPTLVIPPQTGWVTVSGYRRFSFDSATGSTDFTEVALYKDENYQSPYNDLFLWDSPLDETSGWVKFSRTDPGANYVGLSLQLSLIGIVDDSYDDPEYPASNFFYDDLSFAASYCIEP